MQPALSHVKALFGASGYKTYANALNRHPISFHTAISNPTSRISSLVSLSCALLRAAKDAGCDPQEMLEEVRTAHTQPHEGPSEVEQELEKVIGADALDVLSSRFKMSMRDIRHAVRNEAARHHPHFRLIAAASITLKQRGVCVRSIIEGNSSSEAADPRNV